MIRSVRLCWSVEMATFIECQSHLHFTRILMLDAQSEEFPIKSIWIWGPEPMNSNFFPRTHVPLRSRAGNWITRDIETQKIHVEHTRRVLLHINVEPQKKKKVLCPTVRVLKMVRAIILLRVDLPTIRCGYACGQDPPLFIRGGSHVLLSLTCFPCSRSVPSLPHLKVCKVTL